MSSPAATPGRLLARNSILNLVGLGAPVLVALLAIPPLIEGLGMERFGVLTIAWMVIGYFSLFDLGLSRALTQLVAEKLGRGAVDEVPSLSWTALALMLALGVVGAAIVALLTPWLVESVLTIPPALRRETATAFYLLAFALPWVISTAGLRGLLEASQRFGLINALRVPMGIFTFVGPLLVLPFSRSLVPVTAVLVVGRLLAWLAHLIGCLRVFPLLRSGAGFGRQYLGPLLRFGSWMTVSNLVSPVMVYFDRFLIAALISMTAVTYYVTPYELVIKLLLIPSALLGVFFPAFAAAFSHDRSGVAPLFDQVLRALLLALFPVCLLMVIGAREGLTLWLGADFAAESTRVLQWLAIGVFVNGLGHAPFAMIQSAGRPDLTGKLHLVELPIYAAALWWMTREFGIVGAAMAWTARVGLDTAILLGWSARLLPEGGAAGFNRSLAYCGAAAVLLGLAMLPGSGAAKLGFLGLVLPLFAYVGWNRLMLPAERGWLRRGGGVGKSEAAVAPR